MRTDIEIILSGDNFPTIIPVGAVINYGINSIPVATVELDARSTALLCNFEQHRRKLVRLVITTSKGCLRFDGFLDGAMASQNSGSLGLSLVIKSRYQWLLETFTRVPGLHPSSIAVFDNLQVISADINPGSNNFINGIQLGHFAFTKIDMERPLFDVLKSVYIESLKIMAETPKLFKTDAAMLPMAEVTAASEVFLAQKLPLALKMLESIDTAAVANTVLTGGSQSISTDFVKTIVQTMTGSMLEALFQISQQYGCNVVIGNSNMYIVPDVGFISVPHLAAVDRTQHSTVPNIIFPAEYTSYQFNDAGYRDIKGCYLATTAESMPMVLNGQLQRCLGHFIDRQASGGGILVEHLPQFISGPLDFIAAQHSGTLKSKITNAKPLEGKPEPSIDEAKQQWDIICREASTSLGKFVEDIANNWAQLTYLQRKFADRTGGINAIFDPGWAPGCLGTLYTRHPGTWIDFRVTSVTHSFTATPGAASAGTSISFDCGRMGGEASYAIDSVALYGYNYDKSVALAGKFVSNVT